MNTIELASSIVEIANENMASAIKMVPWSADTIPAASHFSGSAEPGHCTR